MSKTQAQAYSGLREKLVRLRGDSTLPPDASIIIPVNAQSDLTNVLEVVEDIAGYSGKHSLEIILVINNYAPESPPELDRYRRMGIHVVAVPTARRSGEVVIVSARALGVEAASSKVTIHFDSDCRIKNVDALLDWYITTLESGVGVAYTHVGFYDLRNILSVHVKVLIHNTVRWVKRNFLGIPTTRGSNYAIARRLFLELYRAGKLSVDLQIGPAAKLAGARVAYSGKSHLTVLTSGRRFRGGWVKMIKYLRYRLRYNLMAIPTRSREVTRNSWDGFDKESDSRALFDESDATGVQ